MVYFNEDTVDRPTLYSHFMKTLSQVPLDPEESRTGISIIFPHLILIASSLPPGLSLQMKCVEILRPMFESQQGLVEKALKFVSQQEQVMKMNTHQALSSMFSLVKKTVSNVVFGGIMSLSDLQLETVSLTIRRCLTLQYLSKQMLYSLMWGFGGSLKSDSRLVFVEYLQSIFEIKDSEGCLLDYFVDVKTGAWTSWQGSVPAIKVESKDVGSDFIVPTIDTVRHVDVLRMFF